MNREIQLFLGVEVVIFLIAALTHFEILFDGYADRGAAIAESVIGVVLIVGLIVASVRPAWARTVGIVVQAFALLGTFVGLALLIAVGPGTLLDVTFHLVMALVLITGLMVAIRARSPGATGFRGGRNG
jgi:hypothetical protein